VEVPLQVRSPSHGGLTPAAPGTSAFVDRKSRNSVGGRTCANKSGGVNPRGYGNPIATASANAPATVFRTVPVAPLQVRFPSHGGLTPAALTHAVRLLLKSNFCAVQMRIPGKKSWGRKPPVIAAPERHRVRRVLGAGRSHPCGVVAAITEQHWRPPAHAVAHAGTPATVSPRIAESPLPMRLPTHGGLTPAAPGTSAFVDRKSRNSVGGQTRASKSGGVSPPWFHKCNCTDVRQHTVGSHPPLCGSVLASASPEPRRADARCS